MMNVRFFIFFIGLSVHSSLGAALPSPQLDVPSLEWVDDLEILQDAVTEEDLKKEEHDGDHSEISQFVVEKIVHMEFPDDEPNSEPESEPTVTEEPISEPESEQSVTEEPISEPESEPTVTEEPISEPESEPTLTEISKSKSESESESESEPEVQGLVYETTPEPISEPESKPLVETTERPLSQAEPVSEDVIKISESSEHISIPFVTTWEPLATKASISADFAETTNPTDTFEDFTTVSDQIQEITTLSISEDTTQLPSQPEKTTQLFSQSVETITLPSQSEDTTHQSSQSEETTSLPSQSEQTTQLLIKSEETTTLPSQSEQTTQLLIKSEKTTTLPSQSEETAQLFSQSEENNPLSSQSEDANIPSSAGIDEAIEMLETMNPEDTAVEEVDPATNEVDSDAIVDVIRNFISERDPILELFLSVCFVHPNCLQLESPLPVTELGEEGRQILMLLQARRSETARTLLLRKVQAIIQQNKENMFKVLAEEVGQRGVSISATKNIIDAVKRVWLDVSSDLGSVITSIQEIFSTSVPATLGQITGISQIGDILQRIPEHVEQEYRDAAQHGYSRYRQHGSWDSWKFLQQ